MKSRVVADQSRANQLAFDDSFRKLGRASVSKGRAEKLRTRAPPQPGSGGKQSVFSLHQRAWAHRR